MIHATHFDKAGRAYMLTACNAHQVQLTDLKDGAILRVNNETYERVFK